MAWRNPRYGYVHALRDAVVIAKGISVTNEQALTDDRRADLCVAANDTKLEVDWDRVALFGPINRLWLPGVIEASAAQPVTIELTAADDSSFVTNPQTLVSDSIDGFDTDPKSYDFTSNSQRFLRLTLSVSQQDTLSLGECLVTNMLDTIRGPAQGWRDEYVSNRLAFQKESGAEYTIALGPDRRSIEYIYRDIRDVSDHQVLEGLWQASGSYIPFLLDPAYDTTPGGTAQEPVWMKLDDDPRIIQDTPVPQVNTFQQAAWDLRMLEHIA